MTDVFDQMISDLLDDQDMGVDAIYQPSTGVPIFCRVFYEEELAQDPGGFDANSWSQRKSITGRLADFGKEPDSGETFTIGATVYTVTRDQPENDGYTVKVYVK